MTIRPSTYADIDALMAIFAYARKQMAADGNPTQWGDGYPSREQLEHDIQRGVSKSFDIKHIGKDFSHSIAYYGIFNKIRNRCLSVRYNNGVK